MSAGNRSIRMPYNRRIHLTLPLHTSVICDGHSVRFSKCKTEKTWSWNILKDIRFGEKLGKISSNTSKYFAVRSGDIRIWHMFPLIYCSKLSMAA